jgi:hypothetical protein
MDMFPYEIFLAFEVLRSLSPSRLFHLMSCY